MACARLILFAVDLILVDVWVQFMPVCDARQYAKFDYFVAQFAEMLIALFKVFLFLFCS